MFVVFFLRYYYYSSADLDHPEAETLQVIHLLRSCFHHVQERETLGILIGINSKQKTNKPYVHHVPMLLIMQVCLLCLLPEESQ